MLERLPTELISLVVDATSTGAWERKALLDSLSSVNKSYRCALRPLRESIVHVPKAAVIPLFRLWPAATRKRWTLSLSVLAIRPTVSRFSLRDYSRLLSILPKIKHIYLQRVEDSYYSDVYGRFCPCRMWFELNSFNPFKQCLSLSLSQSQWRFLPSLETARFKLRRLRLDLLPKISTDFVNQLDAAQVDFCRPSNVEPSGVRQIGSSSTPVLFSINTPSFFPYLCPKLECMKYLHVQSQDGWEVDRLLRILPGLKAVSWETSDPRVSIKDLESPDHPFPEITKQNIKRKSVGLFAAGSGDDDYVDSGFLRFLDSREPRS
ncbi:hypothetical protein RHOSPDRAFT_31775 [Rhodotorula sp. JG-1b]|nr:hypothetical protein RHOSPDRAFT_31775 [Rhodotorula sp. JG-1b]